MSGYRTTTMGTRVIIRSDSSYVQITKGDEGLAMLTVHDGGAKTIDLRLSQRECLILIEYLAVAATPNTEKDLVEMFDDADTNTKAMVLTEGAERGSASVGETKVAPK